MQLLRRHLPVGSHNVRLRRCVDQAANLGQEILIPLADAFASVEICRACQKAALDASANVPCRQPVVPGSLAIRPLLLGSTKADIALHQYGHPSRGAILVASGPCRNEIRNVASSARRFDRSSTRMCCKMVFLHQDHISLDKVLLQRRPERAPGGDIDRGHQKLTPA